MYRAFLVVVIGPDEPIKFLEDAPSVVAEQDCGEEQVAEQRRPWVSKRPQERGSLHETEAPARIAHVRQQPLQLHQREYQK